MRLRQLESVLSGVRAFESPKVELEQYPTSAHLAACMLFAACEQESVEGEAVADLGTGTGMLAIAAEVMGAETVVGVDVDPEALQLATENVELVGAEEVELVQGVVGQDPPQNPFLRPDIVDTVIMNPPFGTRNAGVDMAFVREAARVGTKCIYSLHKTSTREHVLRALERDESWSSEVLAEMRFDIPRMYHFHKKKSADVEVDLVRYWCTR